MFYATHVIWCDNGSLFYFGCTANPIEWDMDSTLISKWIWMNVFGGTKLKYEKKESYINGLVQEKRNSIANALELHFLCIISDMIDITGIDTTKYGPVLPT